MSTECYGVCCKKYCLRDVCWRGTISRVVFAGTRANDVCVCDPDGYTAVALVGVAKCYRCWCPAHWPRRWATRSTADAEVDLSDLATGHNSLA